MIITCLIGIFSLNFFPIEIYYHTSEVSKYIDVNAYSLVDIDTSQNDFRCYIDGTDSLVGMYYVDGALGFWNSGIDTFLLKDNRIIVFINPFPDVHLILNKGLPNANGISANALDGLTYIFDEQTGKVSEACVRKDKDGTLKYYFDEYGKIWRQERYKNNFLLSD